MCDQTLHCYICTVVGVPGSSLSAVFTDLSEMLVEALGYKEKTEGAPSSQVWRKERACDRKVKAEQSDRGQDRFTGSTEKQNIGLDHPLNRNCDQ